VTLRCPKTRISFTATLDAEKYIAEREGDWCSFVKET